MEMTETHDGTIEGAVDLMISPELGEAETETETAELESEESEQEETEEGDEDEGETESEDEEQETEESEEESEDQPELHTVSVDGEEVQVSLNDLKRGYSGQQYVQKGMREVADSRKETEVVYTQLQDERRKVSEAINLVMSGQLSPPPPPPDQSLLDSDPIGYMQQQQHYDQAKALYDGQLRQIETYGKQQAEAEMQANEAYFRHEAEQLRIAEPDYIDPVKTAEWNDKLIKIGDVYGYSEQDIAAVVDHRARRVLMDAARFHELKDGSKKTVQDVKKKVTAKKAARKKVSTSQNRRSKQRAKLKGSGNINDAVNLIMNS